MCCGLNIRRGSVCPNLRHFPQKDQDQENIGTSQVLSIYGLDIGCATKARKLLLVIIEKTEGCHVLTRHLVSFL